jgi:hypothetical protein
MMSRTERSDPQKEGAEEERSIRYLKDNKAKADWTLPHQANHDINIVIDQIIFLTFISTASFLLSTRLSPLQLLSSEISALHSKDNRFRFATFIGKTLIACSY